MANTYLSLTELAPAFAERALVLVPNNRLRNHLLRAFALQQTAPAWLKPNIQSLTQWLDSLWESLQASAYESARAAIASSLQRQLLWEKAISQSPLSSHVLQPQPLAQQADSALRSLELWALKDTDIHSDTEFVDQKSNAAQLSTWLTRFRADLTRQNSITKEDSFHRIIRAFHAGSLNKLPQIYLEGFDDLPPLIQALLAEATDQLIRLPNQQATCKNLQSPLILRTQLNKSDDEIRAAALWSKSQLTNNPDSALIGIVVPNLGQCRDKVERIFTEIFEPCAVFPNVERYTLPFNFSAGTPLGSTPLIHSLFEILHLHSSDWSPERLCQLLQSPFWGNAEEESAMRTHIAHRLLQLEKITLSTSDLRYCAHYVEQKNPSFVNYKIHEKFEKIEQLLRDPAQKKAKFKTAREWLNFFNEILSVIGWPGERRLDSQEYQQLNQWFDVRNEFSAMDHFCAPMNYTQACRYLRQLADKNPFQAQTPDSPIQILGALEAAGLQFSHVWVMGLSDNQWPPTPAPNPLLPLALQRQHKMPHASVERELEIAQNLTARYRQSAPLVIFSHAHRDDKGDTEQRASALIRDLPLTPIEILIEPFESPLQQHYAELIASHACEVIADPCGPPLSADEPIRGGSYLFKLQAACPFSAFAQLRLGAKNPEEPTLGLSPRQRGNLLHDALAAIWRELKNAEQLRALSEDQLQHKVNEITQSLVRDAQAREPRALGPIYYQLEQERLSQLLCEWLRSERERPNFQVIAIEQETSVNFADLTLTMRVDRIDQFDNGECLLIDYKTGAASSKGWLGDRPSEPQLPLYTITQTSDTPINAVSFAIINRKQQRWDGLGDLSPANQMQACIKISNDWNTQLNEWRNVLAALASDFIHGDARIDFVDKKAENLSQELAPLHRLADRDALEKYAIEISRSEQ